MSGCYSTIVNRLPGVSTLAGRLHGVRKLLDKTSKQRRRGKTSTQCVLPCLLQQQQHFFVLYPSSGLRE